MPVRTDKNGKLFIDFYFHAPDGRKVRAREGTHLNDTKANRKRMEGKFKAIKYELSINNFDYLRHFPNGNHAHLFRKRTAITLDEWWEQFLEEKSLRPSTMRNWASVYRLHIGPHFGHYSLDQIDEHEILVFRKQLEKKGLKASTINDKIIKVLCMALYRAQGRGIIEEYPCRHIHRLDEDPVDIDPFSFAELKQLLGVLKDKAHPVYYNMVTLWSRTGLRPGEICALRWEHLDKFNHKLLVRATRHPNGNEGPPKTKYSRRDIPLRREALETLNRQEALTGLMGKHIFLTEQGHPFSDAYLRKRFRHFLRIAGLKYRSPKQLRHTFATLHIAVGEQLTYVSRVLGHASIEITAKRYNRFIPDLTRVDGSVFESQMGSSGATDTVTARNN